MFVCSFLFFIILIFFLTHLNVVLKREIVSNVCHEFWLFAKMQMYIFYGYVLYVCLDDDIYKYIDILLGVNWVE